MNSTVAYWDQNIYSLWNVSLNEVNTVAEAEIYETILFDDCNQNDTFRNSWMKNNIFQKVEQYYHPKK